jgi:exopolysaccharide production protein ExoF
MRWILNVAGLVFFLVCNGAAAQTAYRLQPGDTVEIWVAQEEDLRRTVVIGPDGWISFPLAGHLFGQGLTVQELEDGLLDRLAKFYKEAPSLTVMLQPNPAVQPSIFVAGEVTTPGEYRYRAGMTVLHAVSLAGGLYRQAVPAADQDRAVLVERDVKFAQNRLTELSVLVARLQAELNGESNVTSDEVSSTNSLLLQEQKVLDDRRALIVDRLAAQQQAEIMRGRIVETTHAELATVEQRIDLAQRRLRSTVELVAKGAAQATRQFELENEVATLQGLRNELTSDMLAAERAAASETATFANQLQERRTQLHIDMVAAQREQAATRARLADSMKIMSIYRQRDTAEAQTSHRTTSYRIVRSVGDRVTEIDASEMTSIEANDLVRVVYQAGTVSSTDQVGRLSPAPSTVGLLQLSDREVTQ